MSLALARPGSFVWLLGHELRLNLRGTLRKGSRGRRLAIILAVVFVICAAGGGVPLGLALRHVDVELTQLVAMGLDLTLAVIWTLMLSSTLSAATDAFYLRGDLDLLLSSPIPAARVLAVRALGMAVTAMSIVTAMVTPFVIPMAVLGHAPWLAVYPVLAALSLLATAVGLVGAMALFAVLGPRRTRVVAQVLAALVGAAFFMASQIRNVAPKTFGRMIEDLKGTDVVHAPARGVLSWPARAVLGEPGPLLAILAVALAVFTLVVWTLGRRFAANAAAAQSGGAPVRAVAGPARGFRGGVFRAMLLKELRLLRRDPALMSQVLLRLLYLIPLMFLLMRNATAGATLAPLAGMVVFMAGQVASNLAWITLSAEDAPELLASGPVGGAEVRRAKLAAALAPVGALMIAPIAVLAWFSPLAAIATLIGAVGVSVSCGLVNLWFERPAKRGDIRRRRSGAWEVALLELAIGALWGAAAGLTVAGLALWAVAPLALVLGLTFAVRRADDAGGYLMRPAKA